MKDYIKSMLDENILPLDICARENYKDVLPNTKNHNFFAHYVFPFAMQRSVTISLKTYGSKTRSKPRSSRIVEVNNMIHKGCFKKGHKPHNKLVFSKENANLIVKLYKSGSSKEYLAKKLNCSVSPINRILLEKNIKLRSRSEVSKTTARKYTIWNKGKKMPEISKRYKGSGNPMYGRDPWNKGTKGIMKAWNKGLNKQDPRVKKIIEKQIGKPRSKETKKKLSISVKRLMTKEYKKKISDWTKKGMTKDVRKRISKKKKEWIKKNPELARKYMEPWLNSGTYGYGTFSIASDGHKCASSFELWVDEKLTENGLKHKIHPPIPNSTKYADFLVNGIYIEVDGMRKETDEDWNGKLEIYRKNNLKLIIIKPNDDIDKIMEDIINERID